MEQDKNSREQKYDSVYFGEVLATINNNIFTPESLQAEKLILKIQDIKHTNKNNLSIAFSSVKLQSWVTYAAAFALVVCLYYVAQAGGNGNIISGNIAIMAENQAEVRLAKQQPEAFSVPQESGIAKADQRDFSTAQADQGAGLYGASSESAGEIMGVGGSAHAIILGSFDDLILALRLDTIEIFNSSAQESVANIAIDGIISVPYFDVFEDTLVIIAQKENGTAVVLFDISDSISPQNVLVQELVGNYVGSSVEANILHVTTLENDALNTTINLSDYSVHSK